MASMAKIQIIGNVGRDPEMRMTPQGRPVCDFSVAVNRVSNAGGERQEQTDWYRVSCWGKQAETAQQMGRNEGAIKALQHRAVRRLAQLLPAELR